MSRSTARRLLVALGASAALVAGQLAAAPPAHADNDTDPLCYTTPGDADPFYNGPTASRVYDDQFRLGVKIPPGLIDDDYDPQGMAAWPNWDGHGEDLLLISAYHDANHDAEPDGPSAVFGVVVSGSRHGTALGRMLIASGHVGGLAVKGGWLYVGSEKEIRGYRLSTVRGALAGANTSHVYARDYNRASTYTVGFMGNGDGRIWAGEFDQDNATHLNGYTQTSTTTGAISYVSSTQAYAPKKTQGVVVTPSYVIFSTSWTRGDRGNLWVMPRNQHSLSDANSYCFRAPSMNEGITQVNGRLYVSFEGASHTYTQDPDDHTKPRNQVEWVHSGDAASITRLYTSGPAD